MIFFHVHNLFIIRPCLEFKEFFIEINEKFFNDVCYLPTEGLRIEKSIKCNCYFLVDVRYRAMDYKYENVWFYNKSKDRLASFVSDSDTDIKMRILGCTKQLNDIIPFHGMMSMYPKFSIIFKMKRNAAIKNI